jgi:hypothetical protein
MAAGLLYQSETNALLTIPIVSSGVSGGYCVNNVPLYEIFWSGIGILKRCCNSICKS